MIGRNIKVHQAKIFSIFMAIFLFLSLVGCTNLFSPSLPVRPSPTPKLSRIVFPPCGSAISEDGSSYGVPVPANVNKILGFQLLLPKWLPSNITWDSALLVGAKSSRKPAPLFFGTYGTWISTGNSSFTLLDILAVNESPTFLSPTTDIDVPLHILDQMAIKVGNSPGVLFHLDSQSSRKIPTVTEIIWSSGASKFRVITSIRENIKFDSTGQILYGLNAMNDSMLINIVQSFSIYRGCNGKGKVNGVS